MTPLLLLALGACDRAPDAPDAADRARYAAMLAAESEPPATVRAGCGEIRHAGLRGDCQLAALGRADREQDGELAAWCPEMDRGTPRSECWFVVAERRRRTGDLEGAAQACGLAGPFEEDCARHLWEEAVVALAAGAPPARWAGALPAVSTEIERWVALLPGVDGLAPQMWARFYERGLARPGVPLDLGACTPLPRPDATRCREAGTALYARRLARRADAEGLDLCARAARASAWTELVPARTHPRLDEAVAALQAERCPAP
jgi:hypothetical protein